MTGLMIETNGLVKHFGRGERMVKAVNGIDIRVEGGIHGFLGPNGAGKSTTIKMLVGAISITSGKAKINGYPAGSRKANASLGYLPEHPKFYENMSLRNYLVYMGRLGGMTKAKALDRAIELSEWLEVSEAFDRSVLTFSTGMKQRAGIAQALIHEPELVILDEPTANLDAIGRMKLIEQIKSLAKEMNITVFVSSHVLSEVEKLADTLSIINRGNIVLDDDMAAIKRRFAGHHYVLNTLSREDNLKIFERLKSSSHLKQLWTDPDGTIQLIIENEEKFKTELPALLYENRAALDTFKRIEVTLDTIFMRVVQEAEEPPIGGVEPGGGPSA